MEFVTEKKVYYHNTDAYGILWHGNCVKWFEESRVDFCDKIGVNLLSLEKENIIFPVVSLNIRYKSPAFLNDNLKITTKIEELKHSSILFSHVMYDETTEKTNLLAQVIIVAVQNRKLIRKMPDKIFNAFELSMQN